MMAAELPAPAARAEVVVVGAGPAGSLAALVLARSGVDVVLVDRAVFPRDKTCGDALMPDAMAALRSAGLAERVLEGARRHDLLRIYSPDGTPVAVRGEFAVLPRLRLDECLRDSAVEAGARFVAPALVAAPLERPDGAVGGVIIRGQDGTERSLAAPVTIIATGAGAVTLKAFGLCERSEPSAIAARCYLEFDAGTKVAFDHLCISYDSSICPGYGWIFPGPRQAFNIGVGYFYDARLPSVTNLRHLMARFLETFPPARELAARGGRWSELKGAPLRTGLRGARLSKPGLLVAGEAAGLTYPISGEGIGKAMESGLLAAETVAAGLREGRSPGVIARDYRAALTSKLAQRLRAYSSAQRWVAHPRLVDFLAHRANSGTYVRRQIEGLINETSRPGAILSVTGIVRALFS